MTKEKALPILDQCEILYKCLLESIDKTCSITNITNTALASTFANMLVMVAIDGSMKKFDFMNDLSGAWDKHLEKRKKEKND